MKIIISLLILCAVVVPIALYKRSKSLRFRLIETRWTPEYTCYIPQVRIGGKWLYLNAYEEKYLSAYRPDEYLDSQDALELIDKFKSAGNFSIPSNRKLSNNQKQIIVE